MGRGEGEDKKSGKREKTVVRRSLRAYFNMCWRERGGPETGRRGGAIPPFGESSHPLSTTGTNGTGSLGQGEQAVREEINPAGIVNSDNNNDE